MKILVFHGYLLRGTGSNIYNANLARALAGLGHEVHLLCQDRDAGRLDWVDATGDWGGDGEGVLEVRPSGGSSGSPASAGSGAGATGAPEPGGSAATGTVTVYCPPIGEILPVYVEDPYEGFEARAFPRLSDPEIEHYIEVNVTAVKDVIARAGPPDAALANHLIMGPAILSRAGVRPFAVKNHGSDLEYTVKPHPRFLPWVREGLEPAAAILVGSHHTAASLWAIAPDLDLQEKTGLGPPGVDTARFTPLAAGDASGNREDLQVRAITDLARRIETGPPSPTFGRDADEAVSALGRFAAAGGPRVVFIGKLIVSKGVDLLVAAWPVVHAANPRSHLLLGGFGAYEAGLRALAAAIGDGDLDAARGVAEAGRALEGGEEGELEYLAEFLADPPDGYAAAAVAAAGSISFAGRLEHDEVAAVLPAADAMVVPSTFPEAFGMVAAEGAAAGVLPICARHSGLAEVTAVLAADVPAVSEAIDFELGRDAVADLAGRINGWLAREPDERTAIGREIAESADRNWSWEGVARDVISASDGKIRPVSPE